MSAAADPALARVWAAALTARERVGYLRDGTFVVDAITVLEADALDALPWRVARRRILSGTDLRERLSRFEAAIHDAGVDPIAGYERYAGRAPRDLPAERSGRREHASAERARVHEHPAATRRVAVAEALRASQIRTADVTFWLRALDVVTALPAEPVVERAVLSARLFGGDAHVLDTDTKVERLVRGLLERLDGGEPGARPVRELWLAWGVESDPLSSTALTLNLGCAPGSPLAAALAALHGGHAVLTLAQLEECPVAWAARDVYVCENPTVVRAAQRALATACAPLVCTGGWPSAAVSVLLGQLRAAGARLHHHGDFDWDGLAIHQALARDHGVRPWRYDAHAYETAVRRRAEPLRTLGARRRSVGGPLADAMAATEKNVPEELVLEDLLADLRRSPSDRATVRGGSVRHPARLASPDTNAAPGAAARQTHAMAPTAVDLLAPVYRLSVAQYRRMGEIGLFDGEDVRVELIDGVVLETSPADWPHLRAVMWLNRALEPQLGEGHLLSPQQGIRLPELQSMPEPDITVLEVSEVLDAAVETDRPLLVIEVANASLQFDRITKSRLYARHGVEDYWIANLEEEVVEVHRDPAGEQWNARTVHGAGEVLQPLLLDGVSVELDALFDFTAERR